MHRDLQKQWVEEVCDSFRKPADKIFSVGIREIPKLGTGYVLKIQVF